VGGIVTEDINAHAFKESDAPEGITFFNPDIPGGAKYWLQPVRASVEPDGRIILQTHRASEISKALCGAVDHKTELPDYVRGEDRTVNLIGSPSRRLSRKTSSSNDTGTAGLEKIDDVFSFLRENISSKSAGKRL
jgi:hypothetical protein